jgi:hypothetical protein
LQGDGTDKTAVDLLRDRIAAEETVAVDLLNYRANGAPFLNRLLVAPIFDDKGVVRYFMGIQKEVRPGER